MGVPRWSKQRGWRSAAALAVAVILGLAACTSAAPAHGPRAASRSGRVISLTTISTLRSLFNRDNGHPRLVLLFSPT
jgi:hypothetical protein